VFAYSVNNISFLFSKGQTQSLRKKRTVYSWKIV